MENYLSEAFKSLDILDEDVFEVDKDGLTALKDFEDKDEDDNSITVVDPDAESEEDLEDSYIGKVILDCSVCHTDIYKDKEDVVIDEESDLANIGEECPYCYSSEGFKVIGEVKPFVETTFETDDDVEVKVENESLRRKRLRESKRLDEWFESEPFAVTCSVDEWEAFKNGELLFDLDSEELVTLDDAKNSGLENCLEYDRYEDYGERVKNGRVAFLMYDPGEEYHYVFNESLHEDHSPVSFSRKNTSTNDVKSYMRAEHSNEGVKDNIYTISIDWVSKLKNENGVIREVSKALGISPRNITVNTMNGPGGGWPEISISGSLDDLYKALLVYTDGDSEYALDLLSDYSDVDIDVYEYFGESLHEDTVKQGKYWVNKGDEGTHGKFRTKKAADEQRKAMFARGFKTESLKESCSISQCQKWVDYDMKKYKKISNDTMEKIKSSGYSVVKDQYGDYEVIADRKDESLKESQSLKSDKGNRLYVGWTPFNSFDDFKNRWFENNSYDKYVIYKNGDKWVITTKHAYEKSDNPTWYEIDSRLMRDIKKDAELKKLIKDESLKESIEDITIDTGDQEISVSARDKEKKSDGEMIAPLSDEMKADIETNSDDVDVDVDEFSEEDFDELGESYLKKVYENVKSYKTTSAKTQGNKLFIEGLIKFSSGKEKKTSFVFESRTITKSGKAKLIGENLQISRGHKSFKLTGTVNNGKFISESLNYNYRVKNGNSSQRVYGTAKKSK